MDDIIPMESNPEIMNKYLLKLGVPQTWHMVDVVSLDKDALEWVPKPVLAVVLLFPLSESYEKYRIQEENGLLSIGEKPPKNVFHLKQVVGNICGIVALAHSIVNNTDTIELEDGLLKTFIKEAKTLDASEKGMLLAESKPIIDAYNDIAKMIAEAGTETDNTVTNHFVTFTLKDGMLYELDGRKVLPINHGQTTSENFLETTVKVIQKFIARDPDNIAFNVVALVKAS